MSDMLRAMAEIPQPGSIAPSPSRAEPMDVPVRPRNPGTPLDLEWVEEVRVNRSAVERRAATIPTRRTVKKEWQAAWLLRAITLMDLTTLAGDDTPGQRAAALRQGAPPGARRPRSRRWASATSRSRSARCASTTRSSPTAVEALRGLRHSGRRGVHRVSRRALSPFEQRIAEIRASVAAGARGDRHRHHPRPRAHRQLAGALRRGARRSARPAATRT